MHDDELDINETLVKQLLSAQFPEWSNLDLKRIKSDGTDNAIYRLGADMCVRLPRIHWAANDVEKEHKYLPQLARALPLAIPAPLGIGLPQANYPWHWSVYNWLEGEDASIAPIADQHQVASDLANFLIALQQINPSDGPPSRRGVPLSMKNNETRKAIGQLHAKIDTAKASAAWEECLKAPVWDKSPVWLHGDLLPANLLVNNGRLSAIIDWGLLGVGDPACDLIVAWSLLSKDSRETFRAKLAIDDATWIRGRGWALSIAITILPYYWETNPGLVKVAQRILGEVLNDV